MSNVGVLAWDMAHNALGRAWMLADVLRHSGRDATVAGPLLQGAEVWQPLRGAQPPVDAFRCRSWASLLRKTSAYVEAHPRETVIVSKPRFPSMLMGLEYKRRWGARVIVDVDDWELAFVNERHALKPRHAANPPAQALRVRPSHAFWTRIAEGMVEMADAVTVSNPMLQSRFGGTIVRHARNERDFDASRFDAGAMRQRYGLPPRKRIVMFLGTPKRHKGLLDLLSFMAASGRTDLLLCVVDSFRQGPLRAEVVAAGGDRLLLVPPVPFSEAPALMRCADLVCLPQDSASPVSDYQVPAKITDAIAMRVPVLMAPSPAVADLFARGIFVNQGPLDAKAFALAVNAPEAELARVTARAHRVFIDEFCYTAAARTLRACTDVRASKPLPAWADQLPQLAQRFAQAA